MKRPLEEGYHQTLRSGLILYPSQDRAINQVMTDLVQKAPAHFVLLADVTGQVIAARGSKEKVDLIALGSLMAGDLAASQEIARLTGQYEDYQMVLREGQQIHTFIVEAGHYLALLVQVSAETPLGWARMVIQKAAHQLTEVAAAPPEEKEELAQAAVVKEALLAQDELSDLFSDALDELWGE